MVKVGNHYALGTTGVIEDCNVARRGTITAVTRGTRTGFHGLPGLHPAIFQPH